MRRRSLRLAGLLLAPALLLGAGACTSGKGSSPSGDTAAPRKGGMLRMAVAGLVGVSDPATVQPTDQDAMVVLDLVGDGLTAIDPSTEQPVPALATTWSVDGGGLTWTFDLRDATFSDGTPVTAGAVVASLGHMIAASGASLAGARLQVIAGAADYAAGRATSVSGLEAVDDHTVRITTVRADEGLPTLLGSPLYGVFKALGGQGGTTTSAGGSADGAAAGSAGGAWDVGAGPYVPDGERAQAAVERLVPSAGSAGQLDEVRLLGAPNSAAAVAMVQQGQADWASVEPAGLTPDGPLEGGAQLVSSPLGAEEMFGMNLGSLTFNDQRFRQAIVRSVDRTKVIAAGLAGLTATASVVPPGVPGAQDDACGEPCSYDPEAAKALLAQAFPDGGVPVVEVDTSDGVGDVAAASSVRDQLEAVGIPSQVKALPFADYQKFVTTGQQQLFRTGWVGVAPTGGAYLDPLFRSHSLDNLTDFSVDSVDQQLAAAAAEPDAGPRASAYAGIETTILGASPVLPLGSYRSAVALGPGVQDYVARLDGTFVVDQVWVGGATTATTG